MALHRIPLKQLDSRVDTSVSFTEGFGASVSEVNSHIDDTGHVGYDHAADEIYVDNSSLNVATNELQDALEASIGKTIAIPTTESAMVNVSYFRITNTTNTYVNNIRNRLPVVALDVNGNELEISDLTSDQAGLTSVVGNTWAALPYVQFASAPGTTVYFYYGTQRQLVDVNVDDILSGYLPGEVNSQVQDQILEIKGTSAWSTAVAAEDSLTGLSTRVDGLYVYNHAHRFNAQFVEAPTGLLTTFTLPYTERAILGSLQIQFHPGAVREGYMIAPNHYQLMNNGTQVVFFSAPAAGTLIYLSYLHVLSGATEQYVSTYT